MPTAKLTLSGEKSTIELAKKLARERHTSVSAMFLSYISALARGQNTDLEEEDIHPLARQALGMAKFSDPRSDRELMEEALMEKYGLDK